VGLNTRFETATAATYTAPATTVSAFTISWTTNTPSASTTATIADGDAVASTESGAVLFNLSAQVTALITDMAAMKTSVGQLGTDNASVLSAINAGD
jgi:hypothetical protein